MDVRADIRIKNDVVIRFREELGLNQRQFAMVCGVTPSKLSYIENFKFRSVYNTELQKVADAVGVPVETICPESLRDKNLVTRAVEIAAVEPERLLRGSMRGQRLIQSPDDHLEKDEILEQVAGALKALTPLQAKVVRLKFGIGGESHTYDQIGKEIGVTSERVRQIVLKSLGKMRESS